MEIKCSFCKASSDEVAVMPYVFKGKMMNICIDCLADSIVDYVNEEEGTLEFHGLECENCGRTLFIEEFPFKCVCGNIINDFSQKTLDSQRKK